MLLIILFSHFFFKLLHITSVINIFFKLECTSPKNFYILEYFYSIKSCCLIHMVHKLFLLLVSILPPLPLIIDPSLTGLALCYLRLPPTLPIVCDGTLYSCTLSRGVLLSITPTLIPITFTFSPTLLFILDLIWIILFIIIIKSILLYLRI